MFTKLGTFLDSKPLRSAARFCVESGEEFVVMPVREYAMLTGIDAENLPVLEIFDTLESKDEEKDEHGKEKQGASMLAHLPLDEEIGVDVLPL